MFEKANIVGHVPRGEYFLFAKGEVIRRLPENRAIVQFEDGSRQECFIDPMAQVDDEQLQRYIASLNGTR